MAADHEFWAHLTEVQAGIQLGNMGLERLLASFRRNNPGKHPLVERIVSTGTLCQFLAEHRKAGGMHPLAHRREDLLAAGLPLRAAAANVTDGRKSRANAFYAGQKYKDRACKPTFRPTGRLTHSAMLGFRYITATLRAIRGPAIWAAKISLHLRHTVCVH